jgi:catechol 2,3-dioxygenase-like lactoylglutathione lyase family enzyme
MPPSITALPFCVYPVSDMARARQYYQGVLGLVEVAHWDDTWVEFSFSADDPGPVLAVSTHMWEGQATVGGGAVAIETPDFDAMVAHLKANDVPFVVSPMDSGSCMFARFRDPDGNSIVLHRLHD